MGTSTSAAQLGAKFEKMARSLDDPRGPLIAGAEAAKTIFRRSAGSAMGASLYGKRKRIGVKDDFRNFGTLGGVVVTYTGPAHLINNPTQAHRIFRTVTTVRGKGARRANRERSLAVTFGGRGALVGGSLKFADGNFRKTVNHPGTKGKHFFEAAKLLSFKAVPLVVARRSLTDPLHKIFK